MIKNCIKSAMQYLEQLPCGLVPDELFDPDDKSPDNAVAHIATLAYKELEEAIGLMEMETQE